MLNYLHKKDNNQDTNYPQKERKSSDLIEKETSEIEKEIEDVVFPIDNSENNFTILESNLGISDNLQRLIFLEFDLYNSNITKDHIKYFREVNNNFVDKEIHFVLNVHIYFL